MRRCANTATRGQARACTNDQSESPKSCSGAMHSCTRHDPALMSESRRTSAAWRRCHPRVPAALGGPMPLSMHPLRSVMMHCMLNCTNPSRSFPERKLSDHGGGEQRRRCWRSSWEGTNAAMALGVGGEVFVKDGALPRAGPHESARRGVRGRWGGCGVDAAWSGTGRVVCVPWRHGDQGRGERQNVGFAEEKRDSRRARCFRCAVFQMHT